MHWSNRNWRLWKGGPEKRVELIASINMDQLIDETLWSASGLTLQKPITMSRRTESCHRYRHDCPHPHH
jgi:hypothetical protein